MLIGKGGSGLRELQNNSGVKVYIIAIVTHSTS